MTIDRFLPYHDELANRINACAEQLYTKFETLNLDDLDLPEISKVYYTARHYKRKFYSVETAARLLYYGISATQKPYTDVTLIDYGAGNGSLYLLAKMLGCKKVIYSDIQQVMTDGAKAISAFFEIDIEEYITADHQGLLNYLDDKQIKVDLVLSRNVIEHIYDLGDFYSQFKKHQPQAIQLHTTTANYNNVPMRLLHYSIHSKRERNIHWADRLAFIKKHTTNLNADKVTYLAKHTRGLALHDMVNAIKTFESNGQLPDSKPWRSNTVEASTGIWAEHLLFHDEHKALLNQAGYKADIQPGFYDTHYARSWKNALAKRLNKIISKSNTTKALKYAPFIYVYGWPE